MRFLVSCIFQFLWFSWPFKFPVFQISLEVQNEIFMISHVSTLSAFAKILENQEKRRMEESWRTRERRETEILCFRDGVCVLVQLWPCLQFLFLVSCPARAQALLFFLCLCSCWCLGSFSLFRFSFSLCQSLLSPRCCGWLWLGRVHILQKRVATPSCPLALNKENFAVVASRSMTHHS